MVSGYVALIFVCLCVFLPSLVIIVKVYEILIRQGRQINLSPSCYGTSKSSVWNVKICGCYNGILCLKICSFSLNFTFLTKICTRLMVRMTNFLLILNCFSRGDVRNFFSCFVINLCARKYMRFLRFIVPMPQPLVKYVTLQKREHLSQNIFLLPSWFLPTRQKKAVFTTCIQFSEKCLLVQE